METFLIAIIVLVLLEVIGFRVYRHFKKKKKESLTVEDLGSTRDDLLAVLAMEEDDLHLYEACAEAADKRGNRYQSRLFAAIGKSKELHLQMIEDVFKKRGGLAERNSRSLTQTSGALEKCEDSITHGSSLAIYQEFLGQAKRNKQKEASKLLKLIVQTEAQNKEIVKKTLSGDIPKSSLIYVCVGCGSVEQGRHTAFCPICTTPGFNFIESKEELGEAQQA